MRHLKALSAAVVALLPSLYAQTPSRDPLIDSEIQKTGRFALNDKNRDGWDDLWTQLFSSIDRGRPGDDSDHDGKTNYEEMLGGTHPLQRGSGIPEATAEQKAAATRAALEAKRVSDSEKRRRFNAMLESKGVLRKASISPASPSTTEDAPPKEGACLDEAVDQEWNMSMLCDGGSGDETKPKIVALRQICLSD